ncbi:hypothetical protein PMAYCL1PPCAC_22470, partial [Pristionchus mayeri]
FSLVDGSYFFISSHYFFISSSSRLANHIDRGVFTSPQNTTFYLSNCGHTCCKECIDKGRLSDKCSRCSAAAPKFVTIDRSLVSNLQVLFKRTCLLIAEHSEELASSLHFQSNQRALRIKGQQEHIKHQEVQLVELQSQVTTMSDEIKMVRRKCDENPRVDHFDRPFFPDGNRRRDHGDYSRRHARKVAPRRENPSAHDHSEEQHQNGG